MSGEEQFDLESFLSEAELMVAMKMMSAAFEQQLHPIVLVRALLLDKEDCVAWRMEAAKEEGLTMEQITHIGMALMRLFNLKLTEIKADNAPLN